jgi:dienelactone hydrolase
VGPAERPGTWPRDLPPASNREPRQRGASAAQRGGPLTKDVGSVEGGAPLTPNTASEGRRGSRPNPIAGYEDWLAAARSAAPYVGADTASTELGRVLGLRQPRHPAAVLDEGSERVDGVLITRLRWSVGYGPATTAWLLRPAGVRGNLPGVLGMHCHGGVRSVGAEQLVDLGVHSSPRAGWLRDLYYSGRAPANELARAGHVVLVHDTFSWGSRRFDLSRPTPRLAALLEAQDALWQQQGVRPTEEERFDFVSGLHEETLAKAAGALGQTFAGAVLADDLVAFRVLAAVDGVDPGRLGTFGFSGGGGRNLLLAALDHRVAACVISCMMATFATLVPAELDTHSWLLHIPGLWSMTDWPGLTAIGRARFLVQYREDDELFPRAGMEAAHDHLLRLHAGTMRYRGSFTPGGHAFDAAMQEEAWAFLAEAL